MIHPYTVEAGILSRLPLLVPGRAILVTDRNVYSHYRFELETIALEPGEENKTLQTVRHLYSLLLDRDVDRQTAIVAVGGGVVGDLVGFAAATLLRGLPFYQVPTTLLAMVDSSIGGKVGVDLPEGKNLVGAFYLPRQVWVDPSTLLSLPDREISAGMAEVIKHGIIADPGLFEQTQQRCDPAALIERAARVKLEIVARDPYERGERAFLNLGHTLGHALEAAAGYRGLSHGEAVGLGMLAAVRLAERFGHPSLEDALRRALEAWQLPTRIPPLDWEVVRTAMGRDKKRLEGKLRFVLPVQAGKVELRSEVPLEMVREVFCELSS